jgi:hypothetical protein
MDENNAGEVAELLALHQLRRERNQEVELKADRAGASD